MCHTTTLLLYKKYLRKCFELIKIQNISCQKQSLCEKFFCIFLLKKLSVLDLSFIQIIIAIYAKSCCNNRVMLNSSKLIKANTNIIHICKAP